MNEQHYEEYEQEINLKKLLYKIFSKWRPIVASALVTGVIIGGAKMGLELAALTDEEAVADRVAKYEAEMAEYEAEGRNIELAIKDLGYAYDEQEEYNAESVLMQIDHLNEWRGTVNLYVDTDYKIIPGSVYQDENPATRICYAYGSYFSSGDLYRYIQSRLDYDIDEKFLKETVWFSVDSGAHTITISSRQASEAAAEELLTIAMEAVLAKQTELITSVGEHKLEQLVHTVYSQPNLGLRDAQENNVERITNLTESISMKKGEQLEWKLKEKEIEVPVTSPADAVKQGIKWLVLGGIIVGFVMAAFYAVGYVLSGKVQGAESFSPAHHLICELPGERKKVKFAKLDTCFAKWFGITAASSEYTARTAAAAENIGQLVKAFADGTDKLSVALVSDMDNEKLTALAEALSRTAKSHYTVNVAGNMMTSAAAAQTAADATAVVLVAEQGTSVRETLSQMEQQLAACKKHILGVVLTGADAI